MPRPKGALEWQLAAAFAGYTHAIKGASKLAHSNGFASAKKLCGKMCKLQGPGFSARAPTCWFSLEVLLDLLGRNDEAMQQSEADL